MIVVGNILTCLPAEHIFSALEMDDNILVNYLQGLKCISQDTLISNILDTVEHFCKVDEEMRHLRKLPTQTLLYRIEVSGGLDLLEELQKVPKQAIYERVVFIFENYVGVEDN